jgi:hypothetical protein
MKAKEIAGHRTMSRTTCYYRGCDCSCAAFRRGSWGRSRQLSGGEDGASLLAAATTSYALSVAAGLPQLAVDAWTGRLRRSLLACFR